MARPTIVLCPGAWHGPEAFSLIRPKLTDAGHKVIEVDWPSVSRPAEIESFDDDIAYLSAILAAETDAGNEVVIVSHSWSGLPVVSTAGPFGASERAKQGKKGGVVKLLFIAAIVVPGGQERVRRAWSGNTAPLGHSGERPHLRQTTLSDADCN